ncbi:MAG: hypothetical protein ACTHMI_01645 [Mucilaginibacter sp.]
MENGFEKYLYKNRDKIENGAPSPQLWQKLQRQLIEHHQKKAKIIRMQRISLTAAASIVLLAGIGYFALKPKHTANYAATIKKSIPKQADSIRHAQKEAAYSASEANNNNIAATEQETRQSLYYYVRLIQIRQNQIKRLQGIDPDLYKESQKSITDLNRIYNQLQVQLSGSINREKVVEEMIENLQMQEKILKNQLQLLKGLPPLNQSDNEKTVKDI